MSQRTQLMRMSSMCTNRENCISIEKAERDNWKHFRGGMLLMVVLGFYLHYKGYLYLTIPA